MTYDNSFYDTIAHGCKGSAAVVGPRVYDLVKPKSVIDFGCGQGWWLAQFKRYGCTVLGLDGAYITSHPPLTDDEFMAANLETLVAGGANYDLAISLEVAEHLPSTTATRFVEMITGAAPVTLFSAAIPGQGGVGHINEQWPAYWVEKFNAQGFRVSGALRWEFWDDPKVENWYAQNLMIAADTDWLEERSQPELRQLFHGPTSHPWPVIHPVLWDSRR